MLHNSVVKHLINAEKEGFEPITHYYTKAL